MDLKAIEVEVTRLAPKPGEVLLFRLNDGERPARAVEEIMSRLAGFLRDAFPDNKILVMSDRVEVSIAAAGSREHHP